MAASPDVLVIGGGTIGLTVAYELAIAGLSVTVCDKGDLGQEASWAGAGIIPPGNFAKAATAFDQLRAWSSEQFPKFCQSLLETTGIDPCYRACGGIEFLEPEDHDVPAIWQQECIEHHCLQDSTYLLPGMAQIRNPRFLNALIAACKHQDVDVKTNHALELFEIHEQKVEHAAFLNGCVLKATHYIIATGCWAGSQLSQLNCDTGIRPIRGQILQYRTTSDALTRILIRGKRYLVPRGDGVVLAGSTEEPEAGFEKKTTEKALNGLRAFAEATLPLLRNATIESSWAGLRPGSRDGQPFIGYVPGCVNLLAAAGHFRAGIGLSPGTARMIRELILREKPTIDPTPFRLDRPPAPAKKPAFRS